MFDNLGEKGLVFYEVWSTRETPARIDRAGGEPGEPRLSLAPPKGGTRNSSARYPGGYIRRPPISMRCSRISAARMRTSARKTGKHASFHRTQSVDYGIVLDGEITLLMDEGETTLYVGDICIQRGTNHGWVNRGTKPCRIAFILIDGVWHPDIA